MSMGLGHSSKVLRALLALRVVWSDAKIFRIITRNSQCCERFSR